MIDVMDIVKAYNKGFEDGQKEEQLKQLRKDMEEEDDENW